MLYFSIKILISAVLIALISEISKRNSFLGAVLASLPLISIMALIWLYVDTRNIQKVISLSYGIFWLVLPSLALFIALPLFLKLKIPFSYALTGSIIITVVCYFTMSFILKKAGIQI
jgi:intracellular septation protein A